MLLMARALQKKDTLVLTISADSVNAGADRTFCNGQQYIKMNGVANLFTSFNWTAIGDGVFNNSNSLNADYFPGVMTGLLHHSN